MSKFKQLSRIVIDLSRDILSNGCTGANLATGTGSMLTINDIINDSTVNGHLGDLVDNRYEEIQTIKHETTFEKSKLIFCQRHLSAEVEIGTECRESGNRDDSLEWTRVFHPVYVTSGDEEDSCGVEGNVDFSLRSLNGPCGIWNAELPLRRSLDPTVAGTNRSVDEPLQYYCMMPQEDHLKYHVVPRDVEESACAGPTQILVTRISHPDLYPYNPRRASGPWRVLWNEQRGAFVHFVKRNIAATKKLPQATVRFFLDESVLGTTEEQRDQFAQETFVSFSECQMAGRRTSVLVDNHVTTGPLRVILASGCYRWPGGIVLRPNGAFRPDRAISRYHALHARVSREVLVQHGNEAGTVPELLDAESTRRVEDFLKVFRLATYPQVETLPHYHPEIVSDMHAFVLKLSSGIEKLENLHALKRAFQPFVLFLASNCLNLDLTFDESTSIYAEYELQDFETLYRFVLGLLPDRMSHQVFRDCLGGRIATAIDSK